MKNFFSVFVLIGLVVGLSGCNQPQPTDSDRVEVSEPDDQENQPPRVVDPKDFDYTVLPAIELTDVTGGQASGTAYYGFVEGLGTRHQVIARNMPELTNDDFYEGWLVRGDQFFSTGEMKKEGDDYVLYWVNHLNDTPFRKIVITLEPRDYNDLPADHILEGEFADEDNLNVVLAE